MFVLQSHCSALHPVSEIGDTSLVHILLEHGTNPDLRNQVFEACLPWVPANAYMPIHLIILPSSTHLLPALKVACSTQISTIYTSLSHFNFCLFVFNRPLRVYIQTKRKTKKKFYPFLWFYLLPSCCEMTVLNTIYVFAYIHTFMDFMHQLD